MPFWLGWARQRIDRSTTFLFGYDVYRTPRALIGFDVGLSIGAVTIGTTYLFPYGPQDFTQERTTAA